MNEKSIDIAIHFTNTYKKYADSSPEIREARVLECLYPHALKPMKDTDYFAGDSADNNHAVDVLVDCAPYTKSQIGYVMRSIDNMRSLREAYPHRAAEIDELIDFWKNESTFVKLMKDAPAEIHKYQFPRGEFYDSENYYRALNLPVPGAGFMSGSYDTRIVGLMPDYKKLLGMGLTGLAEQIALYKKKNPQGTDFYDSLLICVDILRNTMEHFRVQAESLIANTSDQEKTENLERCAKALLKLQKDKPETLYEAMQMIVIYNLVSRAENYGRLDVVLGDYLASDLETGVLSEESATDLMCHFWQTLSHIGGPHDSRLLIGGRGRENEKNADLFALYAIEATIRTHDIKPVLTLRWYDGQNPALLEKALVSIGQGCIYPTLYNDDVMIPGVMKSMNIPYEDALNYSPLGCGELTLQCCCAGSPNSTVRFLKIFEVVLHNGSDGADGYPLGSGEGTLEEFDTYEKLEAALFREIKYVLEKDIELHIWNKNRTASEYGAVMQSLLTNDCIARGKSIFGGGIRYFGANAEGFGITNLSNSLIAIKKLVYENKEYTLREYVDILDKNFEGHEADRKRFSDMPKYGNNNREVDELKLRLEQFINDTAHQIGLESELDYYTVANVNPGGIIIGPTIAASADGRKCATPMSLGNSPTPGSDTNGLTSMLLSAANSSHKANGGYVVNMNISKETIQNNMDQIRNLFLTYFKIGGQQLNVNCFSKGDLEKALEHPEDYRNLIVRVSGYSARFIDLDEITQQQIMQRTLF